MNNIKTYLFLLTILLSFDSFGQTKTKDIKAGGFVLQSSTVDSTLSDEYFYSGIIPEFPGGNDSMVAYAKRTIHYPKSAIQDSIQGKVVVQFIIDKSGKVTDVKIIKSIRTDLDTLCLAMVSQMPTWTPGKLNGEPVAVRFNWPIKFILSPAQKK